MNFLGNWVMKSVLLLSIFLKIFKIKIMDWSISSFKCLNKIISIIIYLVNSIHFYKRDEKFYVIFKKNL